MREPLIKYLPWRIQESLLYRWYYPTRKKWFYLFDSAKLRFAPGIKMKLLPTDFMHAHIAFTVSYEISLSRYLCSLSRSGGGVMVDVGSNAGYFSLLWASANPESRCIAFEPSPRNVALIKSNILVNGLSERIELQEIALGRDNGKCGFDLGPSEQTGWGGLSLESNNRTIQVTVKRLDNVIPPGMTIKLLKIDTEGADTWVLQGSEKLLRERRIEEIRYEQNKQRLAKLGISEYEAAAFLRDVGYIAKATSDSSTGVVGWRAIPA